MGLAAFLFAAAGILFRYAAPHADWSQMAAMRSALGALVALAFLRRSKVRLRIHSHRLAWARSLLGTTAMVGVFVALASPAIPVGDVATLRATTPIFVALFSPLLLKEPLSGRVLLAMPLALIGVWAVSGPSFDLSGDLALMVLGSAVVSGLAITALRRQLAHDHPDVAALHYSLVAMVTMVVIAGFRTRVPAPAFWAPVLIAGLLGGLGQLAMSRAYQKLTAARGAVLAYVEVPGTYGLSVLFLGATVGWNQVMGAGLIVLAGLLVVQSR